MLRNTGISLLLLLLIAPCARADVVVIVRREAQSAGKYVRVCDIARVDGPENQAREVASTVLGPAPVNGETQEITRWDIESRLYEMGVDAKVTFSGNDSVRVLPSGAPARTYAEDSVRSLGAYPSQRTEAFAQDARETEPFAAPSTRLGYLRSERQARDGRGAETEYPAAKTAPAFAPAPVPEYAAEAKARVAQTVGDYFADKYRAGGAGRPDIEVAARIVGNIDAVPASAHELRVTDAEGKIPGRAKVTLFVRDTPNDAGRMLAVAADTEVYGLALVPVRNIARGEMLGPGSVKAARVRMEWGESYLPPKPAAVSGLAASQALRAGEAIRPGDAAPGEAVKRNQLVIVDTAGRGWRLQAKAKAQGGGAVGDVITVEDLETRARYPARITAPGSVSVIVNKDRIIYNRE